MSTPPVNKYPPTPIAAYMRSQILSRLREAERIAATDAPADLDRLRELTSEVTQRVDAVLLARSVQAAQPRTQLPFAVLSGAGTEPVREFLLIPFGEVVVERPVAGESFVFTPAHAESARRWFAQMGRKLAIDYEHQSFGRLNTRADGLRPAAGWISGLEVRDDGLWAIDVEWTERAGELLRKGEYRYFSPVIFWTDEDHTDVAALGPVALTNDPAMHGVQALAAGRHMAAPYETLAAPRDTGNDAAPAEVDETADDETSPSALRAVLAGVRAEVEGLRQALQVREAEAFVERGLRAGKIVAGTCADWRADYLRDPAQAEARLARSPVLLTPGRLLPVDERGFAREWPGRRAVPAANGTQAEGLADGEAYERAAAAGRVLAGGTLGQQLRYRG